MYTVIADLPVPMTAAIMALETLTRPCAVDLYTDSQYVRGGVTSWIKGWKARGCPIWG